MTSPQPSRNSVRKLLVSALPTDADLDSFLLDFFPDVYRRVTLGMQRAQKMNLLFECEPACSHIVEKLRELETVPRTEDRPRSHPSTPNKLLLVISVAMLIAAGVMLATLIGRWRPLTESAPSESAVAPSRIREVEPPAIRAPQIINEGSGSPINVINSPGTKFYNGGPKAK